MKFETTSNDWSRLNPPTKVKEWAEKNRAGHKSYFWRHATGAWTSTNGNAAHFAVTAAKEGNFTYE